MHNFHFDDQYNTYHSVGSCIAPEGQRAVGLPGQVGKSVQTLSLGRRAYAFWLC